MTRFPRYTFCFRCSQPIIKRSPVQTCDLCGHRLGNYTVSEENWTWRVIRWNRDHPAHQLPLKPTDPPTP